MADQVQVQDYGTRFPEPENAPESSWYAFDSDGTTLQPLGGDVKRGAPGTPMEPLQFGAGRLPTRSEELEAQIDAAARAWGSSRNLWGGRDDALVSPFVSRTSRGSGGAVGPVTHKQDAGAKAAFNKEMWQNAALSAIPGVIQAGAYAKKTPQDVRNEERLAELTEREEEGRLGLTGAERSAMLRRLLGPSQAQARENRLNDEARRATSGDRQSAGALERDRQGERIANQATALQGTTTAEMAHLGKIQQDIQEIEERTAYKSERKKVGLQHLAQAAAPAAAAIATARAGKAAPTLSTSALATAQGLSKDEMELMILISKLPDDQQADFVSILTRNA